MNCVDCGESISLARLKAVPTATKCVECLEESGDVFRTRGYRDYCTDNSKHLGGVEVLLKTPERVRRFQENLEGSDRPIYEYFQKREHHGSEED